MSIDDYTREQIEDVEQEARHRSDINFDEYLNFLMKKYGDAVSGRTRVDVTVEVIRTFERMFNKDYSPACLEYYKKAWENTKSVVDKKQIGYGRVIYGQK